MMFLLRRESRRDGSAAWTLSGRYLTCFKNANWSWRVKISVTLPSRKCQIAVSRYRHVPLAGFQLGWTRHDFSSR
jgi:hypothetical protein